ncbi:thioredoxin-like protein YusE [Virgibacillus pantothenticus]|uniref:Thioredoxin n=1 Tax=Virgibacillus pantothenticus TaxID=1473 RepID=A0A0L0QMR2_VIRPA|nr:MULTISPECIES: thioredoxin family protein [Virgibacillus]API93567.1 thiol reductase thioredoxin [Virgibacillus sp. 6R]KNE19861.1 thioredoxin [Virgibacillus pantothenticus]MBS7430045.1 thioredoxin family protein [Virgibacillus sp. 19R1-5]MBU8564857.1 thioredoxin family protein [Virgibacillus pantothenticus]MBU8599165.1 thioredoxin family protein [Virgibacillus pantothenticus]
MQQVTKVQLQQSDYFLYIFTPLCGTCNLAKSMLLKIEQMQKQEVFLEMNASLHPEFMQTYQVESVPCLLIKKDGQIVEKIYAFRDVANIYQYLLKHKPEMFAF